MWVKNLNEWEHNCPNIDNIPPHVRLSFENDASPFLAKWADDMNFFSLYNQIKSLYLKDWKMAVSWNERFLCFVIISYRFLIMLSPRNRKVFSIKISFVFLHEKMSHMMKLNKHANNTNPNLKNILLHSFCLWNMKIRNWVECDYKVITVLRIIHKKISVLERGAFREVERTSGEISENNK